MPYFNILFPLTTTIFALSTLSTQARKQHHTSPSPSSVKKHLPTDALSRIVTAAPIGSKKHVAHENHEHHARAPFPTVQEPYRRFFDYVDKCLGKLTDDCGKEISGRIFENRTEISAKCCERLVHIGLRCHAEILKATLLLPELSYRDKNEIKKREVEVWDQCVATTT